MSTSLKTVEDTGKALERAIRYRGEGKYTDAVTIYQELIRVQPNNPIIYDRLAQTEAQKGNFSTAVDNYRQAIDLGIDNPVWTYKNLGDALREENRLDEAESAYLKAIEIDVNNPFVYDSLGQMYQCQGNFSQAIDNYRQAIELEIDEPTWTYKNLVNVLTAANRIEEAQLVDREALNLRLNKSSQPVKTESPAASPIKNPNWLKIHNLGDLAFQSNEWLKAATFYQQSIELNPHYFWSHFNLGRAFHSLEKWDEAMLAYQQAVKIAPERQTEVNPLLEEVSLHRHQSRQLESELEINNCLKEAEDYFQQQQWEQAIALYQKVISVQPDLGKSVYKKLGRAMIARKNALVNPQPSQKSTERRELSADELYKVADEHLRQGKLDEAKKYHQKAIAVDPNFAVSYRALGDIYKQQKLFSEAIEHYSKSVEIKPNYFHAYQRLADLLYRQGQTERAIAAYRHCLKINPNQTEIKKRLTDILQQSQTFEQPQANTVAAATIKEGASAGEYYSMGEAYYKRGKLDLAFTAHQKAIELNPNLALSYRALGDIYARKNKPSEAIESYRQAVKLKPDYYYGYQKLGKTLQSQGEIQKAIAVYRRALEVNPRPQDLQQTLKALLQQEQMLPTQKEYNRQDYPRVLVVAPIKFNQQAGGGVTMGNLFREWPQDAIAQIHSDMFTEADYSVCSQYFYLPGNKQVDAPQIPLKEEILAWCESFKPDIIFARPIDRPHFYWWLPQALSQELGIPYVTNVMDDWPARYEAREDLAEDDTSKSLLKQNLQNMFDGAAANIGISPQMCQAYQQRYGNEFVPFHNCIDVSEWSKTTKSYEIEGEFSLLYLGVVTEDKELWSLKDIRDTVLALRKKGYPVKMQIYSAPFCQSTIEQHLASDPSVEYAGYVHPSKLPQILSQADLLVLPINFDAASLKYVGYSIQTKVPEYMASGTPILAYGPSVSPNINYATRENWGLVVDRPDRDLLEKAIVSVIENLELRAELGKYARDLAFRNHDARMIRNAYRQLLADSAFSK